jgi:probable HAF family extracellular repeat protein
MKGRQRLFGLAALGLSLNLICSDVSAQSIQSIGALRGNPYSYAFDVSDNGAIVVGSVLTDTGQKAVRWVRGGGLEELGNLGGNFSEARAVSADGTVAVGWATTANGETHAFRWTAHGGMQDLGTLGGRYSYAWNVSANGSVIVGYAEDQNYRGRAFRWTQATGMQSLGTLTGGNYSEAKSVSADGNGIVGIATSSGGLRRAFLWKQATGMQDLGTFGGSSSEAYGISGDGTVVVGFATLQNGSSRAFRWTQSGGLVELGTLTAAGRFSHAQAVSGNGSVIVGLSYYTNTLFTAFIWTQERGMRNLFQAYASALPVGWALNTAFSVSSNGRYVAGIGRTPSGEYQGWVLDTAATVRSWSFENNDEGWRVVDLTSQGPYRDPIATYTPSWSATGGNPGGHIFWADTNSSSFFFEAPTALSGDLSAYTSGFLRFSLSTTLNNYGGDSVVVVVGRNDKVMVAPISPLPNNNWRPYAVQLVHTRFKNDNINGSQVTRQDFNSIMRDVASVRIPGEFGAGTLETTRLDTVSLLPATIPGDVNADGCVNDQDLLQILLAFGNTGSMPEDLNQDGIVDDADLLIVLLNFGSGTCN